MIEGIWALFLAFLSFVLPMAIPLFVQRWRTLLLVVGLGVAFFAWLTVEMPNPGSIPSGIGAFLGGLMLFGFAGGVIARLVQMLGRPKATSETDSSSR